MPDLVDTSAATAKESIAGQRRVLREVRTTAVVAQPLLTEGGDVLGVLVVVTVGTPGPGMLGAVGEVARYAASQIELAELDASRARLTAEVLSCARRSARTSSTTRSTPSRRSCAPIPTGPAN